jgi:hypothetical protein
MKVYKFSIHLYSDVLRRVSVGLFPSEESLAHVNSAVAVLCCVLPIPDTKKNLNRFAELLPTLKKTVFGFIRVRLPVLQTKRTSATNYSISAYVDSRRNTSIVAAASVCSSVSNCSVCSLRLCLCTAILGI